MTEDERREVLAAVAGKDVTEVLELMQRSGNGYSRRILKFFRWFCKWVPVGIMVWHGGAMVDFSLNPHDMFEPHDDNWMSYAFTYFMLYVLPMVIILASRFFWLCWRYRIPFFYFLGVNAIHIGYWSWYTTNEMARGHICLLVFTLGFYLYGMADLVMKKTRWGKRLWA